MPTTLPVLIPMRDGCVANYSYGTFISFIVRNFFETTEFTKFYTECTENFFVISVSFSFVYFVVSLLLNKVLNAKVSDTRNDDSSNMPAA